MSKICYCDKCGKEIKKECSDMCDRIIEAVGYDPTDFDLCEDCGIKLEALVNDYLEVLV